MDDLAAFERFISDALSECGCDHFSVSELRRHTRETRDEIYADIVAHGDDISGPFVHFIVTHDTAIFTVFDDPFLVYVVPCVERQLISDTDAFAMADVAGHIEMLQSRYGKTSPDASIPRSLAESWLG